MATYIVGDIQACLSGLIDILDNVGFNRGKDDLIAVGDLIGRGPQAYETIAFLQSLGSAFRSTLGNHDLHFLAIAKGQRKANPKDGYGRLLRHPNLTRMTDWLRTQPMAISLDSDTLICHAGLYPGWSIATAQSLAKEVESELTGDHVAKFLNAMYGDNPSLWSETLVAEERHRFVVNALTRMRYLRQSDLSMELKCKVPPLQAPKTLRPWFTLPNPGFTKQQRVFFGHWASLQGETGKSNAIALDTGYIWGGSMSVYNVEKAKRINIKSS